MVAGICSRRIGGTARDLPILPGTADSTCSPISLGWARVVSPLLWIMAFENFSFERAVLDIAPMPAAQDEARGLPLHCFLELPVPVVCLCAARGLKIWKFPNWG